MGWDQKLKKFIIIFYSVFLYIVTIFLIYLNLKQCYSNYLINWIFQFNVTIEFNYNWIQLIKYEVFLNWIE